jgi:predicted phosphodiesterase
MTVQVIELNINTDESIAFIGDLHGDSATPSSRIDNYMFTVIEKIKDIHATCLNEKVKAVFWLGDVFNRLQVTNEAINLIGKAILEMKDSGIRQFSIIGNHDISRNLIDTAQKFPLSILFNFGVIEHLNLSKRVVINKKTMITALDYIEKPVKAYPKAPYNIMLAHLFYNHPNDKYNLSPEDVKSLNYNCIVLGHDHECYPIIQVGNTDIVRPGSVLRGTCHDYNFTRKVGFYILKNPADYSTLNLTFTLIKAARPMEEVVSSVVLNKKKGLTDLTSMMSDLVSVLSETSELNEETIAVKTKKDKNLPEGVKELLLKYYHDAGIMI